MSSGSLSSKRFLPKISLLFELDCDILLLERMPAVRRASVGGFETSVSADSPLGLPAFLSIIFEYFVSNLSLETPISLVTISEPHSFKDTASILIYPSLVSLYKWISFFPL